MHYALLLLGVALSVQAQDSVLVMHTMPEICKPNMISSHPLGLLTYRINHRFSISPVNKASMSIDIGSGNVWLPEVKAYLPSDPNAVEHLSHFPWHKRDSVFQAMPRNYDSIVFRADGVIKTFQLQVKFRLNKQFEVCIGIRNFLLTTGSDPTTIITSDAFIEDFHQQVAGGNDPFARKKYGYNHADIYYRAPTGEPIHFQNGNVVVAGVTTDLIYYPNFVGLQTYHISMNAGLHLGLNTTGYNRGFDAGLSLGIMKQFSVGRSNTLSMAAAGSLIRQRLVNLGSTSTFIHSKLLPAFEAILSYRKSLLRDRFWEIGLDFYALGPYNPSLEFDRITPVGNRLSSHWHYAITHLYRSSQNWSLLFAFGRKWKWMFYVNEDLKVNNAPDVQTGIGVEIPL